MEGLNKRRFLFLSIKLSALFKKSTPGKFAHICHFQQIGKYTTVFEKREFFLKVTFSLPLTSSMLKLPYSWKSCANGSNIVKQPVGKHGIKEVLGVVGSNVWPVSNFAQQLPTTRNQQDVQTNARCRIQRCCVRVARGFGIIPSLLELYWLCFFLGL